MNNVLTLDSHARAHVAPARDLHVLVDAVEASVKLFGEKEFAASLIEGRCEDSLKLAA